MSIASDLLYRVEVCGSVQHPGSPTDFDLSGEWVVLELTHEQDWVDVSAFGQSDPVGRVPGLSTVRATIQLVEPKPTMTLADRNRVFGLKRAPDKLKGALESLYQLDRELPPDKEAVVEVDSTGPDPGDVKFVVAVRPKGEA